MANFRGALSGREFPRRSFLKTIGVAAVAFSFAPEAQGRRASARDGGKNRLNFYNWDTFIGKTTVSDFRNATGVDVETTVFGTSDELMSTVQGDHKYDVIVPSGEDVERLVQDKMLTPLDPRKIPNLANVAAEFRNPPYDPWCAHSAPYTWDVIGVGYRKSKVSGVPASWKWLYDSDRYSGRIALMADSSGLFRCALKYLGHSVNATSPDQIAQVEALLSRQNPHIMSFHDDNGQDLLQAGAADLVMEYNGDIAQLMDRNKDIGFVVPSEGSVLEHTAWAIPKGAPHVNNAYAFINFMLDARVGAEIASAIKYPTPNAAAARLMPNNYKYNPVIFPGPEVLQTCEHARYLGEGLRVKTKEALARARDFAPVATGAN